MSEYNNTYHRTVKMKPVDAKDITYIDFKKEVDDKNPKFKVGDHVRISKCKNIFAKRYTPNWSKEDFVMNKVKNTVPWTYKNTFRIKKVIKRKGEKLYVKWKVMVIHLIIGLIKKI